jgi:zinc and cadmium transporter
MIPALHEHSSIANLVGQTSIFGLGIGFMQSVIILENTLLSQ